MIKYKLPLPSQKTECVILANGEFPKKRLTLSILRNAKYIVCCDGAINNLSKLNIEPDAIVGDCDSLFPENSRKYAKIIHQIKEQETNDLTKAVKFSIDQGKVNLTILGATGNREDHTIGNISLLAEYLHIANVQMITDYGVFVAIDSTATFQSYIGQQVSLFCIDPCKITTHNLKYAVSNQTFTNWWQATLNESTEDEFSIETNGRIIVYRLINI